MSTGMSRIRSAVYEWRAWPEAILFPALLHSICMGLKGLPLTYLLREIRCEEYAASLPEVPPDAGALCRSATVQKAYSADVAVFVTIATVMGIVLSGPYGTLSDLKGRKRALLLASSLNALGDIWLVVCAIYGALRRPWIMQLAAVLSGLGGGFSVLLSGHNAFIADTTRPMERSWYLGLSLVMLWVGGALGPLVSAPLTGHQRYATNLALTALAWVAYILYVAFVLRETRVPSADRETSSILSVLSVASEEPAHTHKHVVRLMVRTFVEPLRVIAVNRTILFPSLGMLGGILAAGSFDFVIPYCDSKFGLSPNEAGVISAVMSISRAVSVVLVLPAVLAAFDKFSKRQSQKVSPEVATDEQTPLLSETGDDAERVHPAHEHDLEEPKIEESLIARELTMVRVGLAIDAVGMLFLWRSQSALEISIATAIGSLGAPAAPSMQALVTIGAPQNEMGRVLAGLSVLESLAVALRNPVFFPLFQATLERMPGAIFGLAAAIYLLCDFLMLFLQSKQYIR